MTFGSIKQANPRKCNPASVSGSRSKSRARRRNRVIQAKLRSTPHRRGYSTNPRFASGSFTTSSCIPSSAATCFGSSPV